MLIQLKQLKIMKNKHTFVPVLQLYVNITTNHSKNQKKLKFNFKEEMISLSLINYKKI